jgi:ELWxxDGT repeat protein
VELWRSSGTAAGTSLVKDIRPGDSPPDSSYPKYLTNVNGSLWFQANDGTYGPQLWVSNGTTAGTFLARDIGPGPPKNLTNVKGTLFFQDTDSLHGAEPWIVPPAAVKGAAASAALGPQIDGAVIVPPEGGAERTTIAHEKEVPLPGTSMPTKPLHRASNGVALSRKKLLTAEFMGA